MIKFDSFLLDFNFCFSFFNRFLLVKWMDWSWIIFWVLLYFFFEIIGLYVLLYLIYLCLGFFISLFFNLDEVLLYMLFLIYFLFVKIWCIFVWVYNVLFFVGMFCLFNFLVIMNFGMLLFIKRLYILFIIFILFFGFGINIILFVWIFFFLWKFNIFLVMLFLFIKRCFSL